MQYSKPFDGVLKEVFAQNVSYENEFDFYENKRWWNTFSGE